MFFGANFIDKEAGKILCKNLEVSGSRDMDINKDNKEIYDHYYSALKGMKIIDAGVSEDGFPFFVAEKDGETVEIGVSSDPKSNSAGFLFGLIWEGGEIDGGPEDVEEPEKYEHVTFYKDDINIQTCAYSSHAAAVNSLYLGIQIRVDDSWPDADATAWYAIEDKEVALKVFNDTEKRFFDEKRTYTAPSTGPWFRERAWIEVNPTVRVNQYGHVIAKDATDEE